EVGKTPRGEDRQVATVDDVEAALDGRLDEEGEVRVEFGRAAGEVHGVGRGVRSGENAVEGGHARLGRGAVHVLVRPVRPGVDVAVAARHVAQLADVDLEDLQRRGRERGPA